MSDSIPHGQSAPETLALIAGRGAYPVLLAQSARQQGVKRLFVIAFRGETDRAIGRHADEVAWIYIGQLGAMLEALQRSGARHEVMAGQITPTSLFRVRMDAKAFELLRRMPAKNADTIFGAVGRELKAIGLDLLPASSFMETHMPGAGLLSRRPPTEPEQRDIELGRTVAHATSGLDIGQTVVIKDGVILAVEAFEGTDETIERAGRLGGKGIVVVKVAKNGHDMRFDIPVVGLHTTKVLRKAGAAALAIEAGRAILLERDKIIDEIDRLNMAMVVMPRTEA